MTFQKIAPLITLAAHAETPTHEARTSAFAACKLVVEYALPVTACVGDIKTLDKIQSLIERAAHENTDVEEARTSAVIACRLIAQNKIRLLPVVAARRSHSFGEPDWSSIRRSRVVVTADGHVGNLEDLLAQFFGFRSGRVVFRTEPPIKPTPSDKPKTRQRRINKNKKRSR